MEASAYSDAGKLLGLCVLPDNTEIYDLNTLTVRLEILADVGENKGKQS